jgi:hypothetical protein
MKSDEEIERERAWLESLIGPSRAEWYAEACRVEYDDDPGKLLWACRYREMAREAARLEEELAELRAELYARRALASEGEG